MELDVSVNIPSKPKPMKKAPLHRAVKAVPSPSQFGLLHGCCLFHAFS
jgi:hypothetical protein